MSDQSSYRVQLLNKADSVRFFERRALGDFGPGAPLRHREAAPVDGFEMSGSFELNVSDSRTGQLLWTHTQPNLITDWGRHVWFDAAWTVVRLGFSPAQEAPNLSRCSVPTDGSQVFVSSNLGIGTVIPATYTRQWSVTFSAPASNRTLGTIFTTTTASNSVDTNVGPCQMMSYTLLTPPKTQMTTQTLEVVYRLSMNPIY